MNIWKKMKLSVLFFIILFIGCVKIINHNYQYYKPTDENPAVKSIMLKVNQLIDDMSNENWDNVYSNFTPIAKQNVSEDDFFIQADNLKNELGVIVDTDVLEIHWANVTEENLKAKPNGYTMFSGKSKYLSNPVKLMFLNPGDNAIVLCETKIRDSNLICWLTLILTKNDKVWGLNGFNLNTNIADGQQGEWFIEKAEELEDRDQLNSAFIYKYIGAQISSPFYPFIVPINSNNLFISLSIKTPKDFPSQNKNKTVIWNINNNEFEITNISFISGPDFISVDISYKTGLKNAESDEAKQERKDIFDYVVKNFPEYEENFDGVYLCSILGSGQAFRKYFEF
jgi:hypothetical protein